MPGSSLLGHVDGAPDGIPLVILMTGGEDGDLELRFVGQAVRRGERDEHEDRGTFRGASDAAAEPVPIDLRRGVAMARELGGVEQVAEVHQNVDPAPEPAGFLRGAKLPGA